MIKCGDWPIGICSWSIGNDLKAMTDIRERKGVSHLSLWLSPIVEKGGGDFLDAIEKDGWVINSTMVSFSQEDYSSLETIRRTGGIVPDDCWDVNRGHVFDVIELTAKLGVKYLTFHAGFIDPDDSRCRAALADKMRTLADAAAERSIMLLMETGQERAAELRRFLEEIDHSSIGVNFDPANMILYGKGDPVEAVKILLPWIKQFHIKDAVSTKVAGSWGSEVVWGSGQAGGESFLAAVKETDFAGSIMIEREAGTDRVDDICSTAEKLKRFGSKVY